jgi:hypothetical protein
MNLGHGDLLWTAEGLLSSRLRASKGLTAQRNTINIIRGFEELDSLEQPNKQNKKETNSLALSSQPNYTDWATAPCRRNLFLTLVDRGVSRSQGGGIPTVVNFSFLDRISNIQSRSKLKNGVFWDVRPCGSCKNRRFGGTWRLLHQSDKNRLTRNNTSCN